MVASGFSQNTCRPARRAPRATPAWSAGGVATTTRSTAGSATRPCQSSYTEPPRSLAIAARSAAQVGDRPDLDVGQVGHGAGEERREPAGAHEAEPERLGAGAHPFTPELRSEESNFFWNATNSATAGAARTTAPASPAPNGLVARPAMLPM